MTATPGTAARPACTAWIAARVVLVLPPEVPGRPNTAQTPAHDDWALRLLTQHPTLKEVDGPLVNGIIALTWEGDPATDEELTRRSRRIVQRGLRRKHPPLIPAEGSTP